MARSYRGLNRDMPNTSQWCSTGPRALCLQRDSWLRAPAMVIPLCDHFGSRRLDSSSQEPALLSLKRGSVLRGAAGLIATHAKMHVKTAALFRVERGTSLWSAQRFLHIPIERKGQTRSGPCECLRQTRFARQSYPGAACGFRSVGEASAMRVGTADAATDQWAHTSAAARQTAEAHRRRPVTLNDLPQTKL